MELFIEKLFLENFYLTYDEKNNIHHIVKDMIINYGDKRVFIDFNENDFVKLKNENPFFALIANTTVPIPIHSIDKVFDISDFSQTIIFTQDKKDWLIKASNKGALCFNFETFQNDINKIINQLHYKIDINEKFEGWSFLKVFKLLKTNNIVIQDNYILGDKDQQKIDQNCIPMLEQILDKEQEKIQVSFLTSDLNPIKNESKYIKEKAKKRLSILNRVLSRFNAKYKIISTDFDKQLGFDFHDRCILTNFSILDCGKGFNLIPYNKTSNSQIISETIFEKYTYKRLNNLVRMTNTYANKLSKLETSEFKQFP